MRIMLSCSIAYELYWRGNEKVGRNCANVRYFSCLSDGNTETSVTEQEVVYVLILDNGVPVFKYVSMEPVENVNAERCI